MNECLIKLAAVAKQFPPARTAGQRVRGLWHGLAGTPPGESAQVLEDVNLRVCRGDSVAILGENGAGKSTLLKIIAGVLRPSSGAVDVSGRVGALLELGAGFHPEFSGRQNVRTAATLAGLEQAEIDSRMADIIEFAQLGAAIDRPVKHYSSGMAVRLGFAVMTATRPDVLISDEVLAVGDESFQKKCIRWLEDYLSEGGTLLLVSHSIYHAQKLCRKAIWLHRGRVRRSGDVFVVSQAYLAHHDAKLRATAGAEPKSRRATIEALRINGADERASLVVDPGGRLEVTAGVTGVEAGDHFDCLIRQIDGALIASHRTPAGGSRLHIILEDLPLLPGHYQIELQANDAGGARCGEPRRRQLEIRGSSREFGSLRVPHRWR